MAGIISNRRIVRMIIILGVALGGFFFSSALTSVYSEWDDRFLKATVKDLELFYLNQKNDNLSEADSRTVVAIVACTKSKEDWQSINATTLHNLLIPSIERTVTPSESENYRVDLVVGFDDNDAFWNNPKNRNELQASTQIPISFISVPKQPDRPYRIPFNEVCRASYEYGAEFIARVNDDSEFVTPGWITKSVKRLSQYNPPWVGVVGPTCRQGKTGVLTHDFVHRTHIDIFGDYYPNEFDNWWIDDWITYIYGSRRTTTMHNWEMFHHTFQYGQRYEVQNSLKSKLKATLDRGEQQLKAFLLRNETERPFGERLVLGTDRLAGVWGPMAKAIN